MPNKNDLVSLLLSRADLPWDEEQRLLKQALQVCPGRAEELLVGYAGQRKRHTRSLQEAKRAVDGLRQLNKKLTAMPWYPGTVLRKNTGRPNELEVSVGHTRMLVGCANGISPDDLRTGQQVLLAQEKNCVLAVDPSAPHCGETAVVDQLLGDKAVLKVREVEEVVVTLSDELCDTPPQEGDRVIFSREHRLAFEVVPKKDDETSVLKEVDSDVTLDQIGGLDGVVEDICTEIVMQLYHRDVVEKHDLRPAKGILLVGPPGVGKTMLAKGAANFVKKVSPDGDVRFLAIPPGAHRHWLYGMSDQIIIKTFAAAKEATGKNGTRCIIFMDELDNWGRRSGDIANTIDSRVMDTLLAQIDGLDDSGNILLIGASNRADDMLDIALLRPGRFGDNVFRIPRPGRTATRDIFGKYLVPDLPYRQNGQNLSGAEMSAKLIDAAVSRICSPNGEANKVATLVMRDGNRRDVLATEIISGALIENIVRRAKYKSCVRALSGKAGITLEDVLDAVDAELDSAVRALKSPRNARDILGLSHDADVVRVELASERPESAIRSHRYVRA